MTFERSKRNKGMLYRQERIGLGTCANENAGTVRTVHAGFDSCACALLLCVASAERPDADCRIRRCAQDGETRPRGKTSGNYNVQQTVEFGYRDSMIGGNLNNYDTFENLQFRLAAV